MLGLIGYALALPGLEVFGASLDANTLLVSSLAMICGFQSVLFGVFAKVYATSHGLLPEDRRLDRLERALPLERLLALAAVVMLVGLLLLGVALNRWRLAGLR